MIVMTLIMMKMKNPISMAMTLFTISIMSTKYIFQETMSSWLPFVVIITFSSGMMTLFIYTATLVSNEKMKTNKTKMMMLFMVLMIILPSTKMNKINNTMKMFSSQMMILMMTLILIMTMVLVSVTSHNPTQTLNNTF